jgi:hypothetical protein
MISIKSETIWTWYWMSTTEHTNLMFKVCLPADINVCHKWIIKKKSIWYETRQTGKWCDCHVQCTSTTREKSASNMIMIWRVKYWCIPLQNYLNYSPLKISSCVTRYMGIWVCITTHICPLFCHTKWKTLIWVNQYACYNCFGFVGLTVHW